MQRYNGKFKEENKKLLENNCELNKKNAEYKDIMGSIKRYDLGNISGLNEFKLKQLQDKMNENAEKIRIKREDLMSQKEERSFCIVCYERKKCIVVQPCNHMDICEVCIDQLPKKNCPRCQDPFTDTLKLNHVNM